jgi:hypothetical protein
MSRKLGLPVKPERDVIETIFPNYPGDRGSRVLVGSRMLTLVDQERIESADEFPDHMPPGYLEGHRGGAAARLLEGFQPTVVDEAEELQAY